MLSFTAKLKQYHEQTKQYKHAQSLRINIIKAIRVAKTSIKSKLTPLHEIHYAKEHRIIYPIGDFILDTFSNQDGDIIAIGHRDDQRAGFCILDFEESLIDLHYAKASNEPILHLKITQDQISAFLDSLKKELEDTCAQSLQNPVIINKVA